ncbi:DUF4998 domain-containing protein [Paraflavitalea sp. CAU 1676]|uniref:DUF4998 domain-containing protein n=1 Tax=Paraflavitalea sp. CAU 1676 TaxID=3032598 RepID=UPI0023DCC7AF|nr:DUF4998 domain-containing protein [Paraflavitalea sp. CAU 1676]MDF2188825.1 DUF4998 domain-containing protein [Paraflavitalea sp. CAU 1676]
MKLFSSIHASRKLAGAGLLLVTAALVWASCVKQDDWKAFLPDQPKVYPGKPTEVEFLPGHDRAMLRWQLVSDPTITQAKVFWNNGHDSVTVAINRKQGVDTVKVIVDKLLETSYTFTIYTYDKEGNRSVPAYVTGRILGAKYESTLLNRTLLGVNYSADSKLLSLAWAKADTVNAGTRIWFTDLGGVERELVVDSSSYNTFIPWKVGTKLYYQSAYKPSRSAIDTFKVVKKDSIAVKGVPISKASWSVAKLPNDVAGDAWGTSLEWLWDGKGGDYPEIYHTDGDGMPHHFTIDLGATYTLTQVENIGRTNANPYHNVTKYEVWGIADLTNAATTLPGNDPGWKAESVAKGWTLLKEVIRNDMGTVPFKVDLLPGIPPVRYIRIRVLETIDHSDDSHMSELTFFYNP